MTSPYSAILNQLLESVEGASGAGFADCEGETVELAGSLEDYAHRLLLAYQSIVVHQLQAIHSGLADVPSQITITTQNRHLLIRPLKGGYFLVLTLTRGADLYQGRQQLEQTGQLLNRDL
jgi:predicted regulator of Ras-like GTPase activity (Roadblock/LC7/MglB family)